MKDYYLNESIDELEVIYHYMSLTKTQFVNLTYEIAHLISSNKDSKNIDYILDGFNKILRKNEVLYNRKMKNLQCMENEVEMDIEVRIDIKKYMEKSVYPDLIANRFHPS